MQTGRIAKKRFLMSGIKVKNLTRERPGSEEPGFVCSTKFFHRADLSCNEIGAMHDFQGKCVTKQMLCMVFKNAV